MHKALLMILMIELILIRNRLIVRAIVILETERYYRHNKSL